MSIQANELSSALADGNIIKNSPLGIELNLEQCNKLADVSALLCLKDGQYLLEDRHKDDTLYVVVEGRLEVVKATTLDDNITLHILRPGDMAGELGFIDGLAHTAGLRALGNCTILSLERTALEAFLTSDPDMVYKVMRAIMRTVHRILGRMNLQYVEMMNFITKQHGRY